MNSEREIVKRLFENKKLTNQDKPLDEKTYTVGDTQYWKRNGKTYKWCQATGREECSEEEYMKAISGGNDSPVKNTDPSNDKAKDTTPKLGDEVTYHGEKYIVLDDEDKNTLRLRPASMASDDMFDNPDDGDAYDDIYVGVDQLNKKDKPKEDKVTPLVNPTRAEVDKILSKKFPYDDEKDYQTVGNVDYEFPGNGENSGRLNVMVNHPSDTNKVKDYIEQLGASNVEVKNIRNKWGAFDVLYFDFDKQESAKDEEYNGAIIKNVNGKYEVHDKDGVKHVTVNSPEHAKHYVDKNMPYAKEDKGNVKSKSDNSKSYDASKMRMEDMADVLVGCNDGDIIEFNDKYGPARYICLGERKGDVYYGEIDKDGNLVDNNGMPNSGRYSTYTLENLLDYLEASQDKGKLGNIDITPTGDTKDLKDRALNGPRSNRSVKSTPKPIQGTPSKKTSVNNLMTSFDTADNLIDEYAIDLETTATITGKNIIIDLGDTDTHNIRLIRELKADGYTQTSNYRFIKSHN